MHAIDLNNISKEFGESNVLNQINLKIESGEIFGMLGPSGAGKTTLIKIMTGQLKASKGYASLFGENSHHLSGNTYAKIGMVLDSSGLYERLSCYDNLKLFSDIFNIHPKRISEVLELVELQDAKNTAVNRLSKGMRQRLVIARAIFHEPKLLFLDEPTSGLDPSTTLKIHDILQDIRNSGTTIFLTTHNMEEAAKLCDNIALLNEGKIIEYGKPDEICRKYNKLNTISLLSTDGTEITLPNSPKSALEIATYFKEEKVSAIHSSEPNLETVFIELTGRSILS